MHAAGRLSEASDGEWRATSFQELASDTLAAYGFFAQVPGIDAICIGLVGFNQGGWIAPVTTSQYPSIAFVVSLSGAGATTDEQLIFREINNISDIETCRFVAELIAPITTRGIMRRDTWQAIAGFDPLPYWAEVQAPAFAALGKGHSMVPVEESARRFNTLSPAPI